MSKIVNDKLTEQRIYSLPEFIQKVSDGDIPAGVYTSKMSNKSKELNPITYTVIELTTGDFSVHPSNSRINVDDEVVVERCLHVDGNTQFERLVIIYHNISDGTWDPKTDNFTTINNVKIQAQRHMPAHKKLARIYAVNHAGELVEVYNDL